MDFQRVLIVLLLCFISSITQAITNPGIAFVHGTKDHRHDAYGGYWKTEYIEAIAKSLPNPENYFVVHCDYSQYMWHQDAGDCTANQLLNFIEKNKLSSLTVYTHSNGGNVIRWILSNPTYNRQHLILKSKISQVIAIAPSSAGTPIADLVIGGSPFEASLSWILGFVGDAIKQQQLADMHIYNEELLFGTNTRPSLPVPFKAIIGTDAILPLSSASYCNGYLLNSGLKLTKLYLDRCADGFLSCDSQKAAGQVWFYDRERSTNGLPFNHNQSRHSCFGLDKILMSALSTQGEA